MSKTNYPYTIVLTHDIDVLSLKELPVSGKTFWGFCYRCIVENFIRTVNGKLKWREYFNSLAQVIKIPFIKLGIAKDPWQASLHKMLEIEKRYNLRSTLYFIPFAGLAGHTSDGKQAPTNRAAYYNINKYKNILHDLDKKGWEIGVHGIDAFLNIESAKNEFKAISQLLPEKRKIGIRIHWLYHNHETSWAILNKAGYTYDSTLGWIDKIGFPENNIDIFKPKNSDALYVLPLNIHDVALLGGKNQTFSNEEAWRQVELLLNEAKQNKRVVTVLWHNNSFSAPRYWSWLYEKIIIKAKNDGANICRAIDAIEMHAKGDL